MIDQAQNIKPIQDIIDGFHHRFAVMDSDPSSLDKLANDFIETTLQIPNSVEDLINLWCNIVKGKPNRLSLIKLASEIIQKSFNLHQTNPQMNLHMIFLNYIFDAYQYVYSLLDTSLQSEIDTSIEIWSKLGIYSNAQLEELKFTLKLTTEPLLEGTEIQSNMLSTLIMGGQVKLDEMVCNYSREMEMLKDTNDNKHRENALKITKDIIAKQNKTYFQHLHYIQVVDKMLDKIKAYNEFNKAEREKQNSNIN